MDFHISSMILLRIVISVVVFLERKSLLHVQMFYSCIFVSSFLVLYLHVVFFFATNEREKGAHK